MRPNLRCPFGDKRRPIPGLNNLLLKNLPSLDGRGDKGSYFLTDSAG